MVKAEARSKREEEGRDGGVRAVQVCARDVGGGSRVSTQHALHNVMHTMS